MKKMKILALTACLLCPVLDWAGPRNPVTQNSNQHGINLQIRERMAQIRKGLKSGRLTRGQAKTEMASLKDIRRQELEYFRQNGRKEITLDQKNQLQQQLGQPGSPAKN